MIIILHDARVQASRNFVTNYGEGYEFIDWANPDELPKINAYKFSNLPDIAAFPSVVDTVRKKLCREPDSMENALLEINGLDTWENAYQTRYNEVTSRTEELINAGTTYNGVLFHCDIIAQQNFTALYIKRNTLSYPYTVWDGNNSVHIQDAAEMEAFYNAGMSFVESKRIEGKVLRDSLSSMTLQELRDFSDTRQ
jgi:hypothetical protein